jgi:HAE1 family hydrophobic/amphiphilic exporter-1
MILLAGIICIPILPIAQFPKIAPPVVTVQAMYIGASAQAVESSVTTPLEEAINGVQGLRYISSQSTNSGAMTITCTFNLDRDLDRAADDVQNAVNSTLARLPPEVKQTGVTVTKNAGSFVIGMGITSRDPHMSALFLSNYTDLYLKNALKRVPGVSDVIIFGERKYAMRLWLDPKHLADNGVTAGDVTAALGDQNVQVAAGAIGQAPIPAGQPYQISLSAQGRLSSPAQFEQIILKSNPNGGFVRLRDVGRVELGAETYAQDLRFDGRSAVGLGILALPTSNALDVSKGVRETLERLQRKFPPGMFYEIAFDSTAFVNESIKEVFITLLVAIALVVLVIYLFLQDWHTTLIPAITIPISLIGTFALMKALGFSINTLTLFGLTLATGLVVDDAIVVIENISRFIHEKGMSPYEGALAAMREISGAVIATSLVLLAVFVPVAFFPGTTGQLYKQFALTIACSITISLFNALTLTPALSALLLGRTERPRGSFFDAINKGIDRMRRAYHDAIPNLLSLRWVIIIAFLCALGGTGYLFTHTSTGFTPDEDQGYLIVTVQAPEGVSLDYTERVTARVEEILRHIPEVRDVFDVNGFGFTGNGANHATMFLRLQPWADRPGYAHSMSAILYQKLYPQFGKIPDAQIFAFNPPSIQGVGNFGGFQYELQDTGNIGLAGLMGAAYGYMGAAARDPALSNVFTTFRNDSPQLAVDLDRQKIKALGIPLSDVFTAMQVELGSLYVNDFNYLNRSYRVYVQADAPFRSRIDDLQKIFVRSSSGAIIPLTALLNTREEKSAPIINHYDLFRAIELNGQPARGYGSGDAIAAMERLGKEIDPPGVSHEWSGISLDEIESGALSALIFGLGIVVVYLVLAAQYESLIDPFVILTAVPLAILGALLAMWGRNLLAMLFPGVGFVLSDVYAQVGFVMLIGLASKNAILIVEFANQLRRQGMSVSDAARKAAETRLRPILMTSFAFILGILPLVVAGGAGSASRHSLGTPVFGGMILSTLLNLIVVPVLYVVIVNRFEKDKKPEISPAD